MKTRKILGWIGIAAVLLTIGFTLYRLAAGQEIGFGELSSIGIALMLFFSGITWGLRGEEGIRQDEELGRRISEKSGLLGYYILLILLFLSVLGEKLLYGIQSPSLLILLAVGIFLHPMLEFFQVRRYR
ncbi:hypothetical protein QWJ34_00290 [Saccharibacillus sp. CPCC 101409]|uniref:hypothetical protein n=1 Tax=Saccharibacillus sp. CPCC 101409 TaxID=3058041 RepID=UPI002673940D|nr:hypothetical protein [Saccharibacillus sp. CPCC 101409]MDO3408195.1 hypothetical protein [Saccharibacillus sp. CPCC 101409]